MTILFLLTKILKKLHQIKLIASKGENADNNL